MILRPGPSLLRAAWGSVAAWCAVACAPAVEVDASARHPVEVAPTVPQPRAGSAAVALPLPEDPAISCVAAEPDGPVLDLGLLELPDAPWPGTDCGELDGSPQPLLVEGTVELVIENTWDGDVDAVRFSVHAAATYRAILQWEPLEGDFDAVLRCMEDGSWQDVEGGALATTAVPEVAPATALPAGACALFVSGFAGRAGPWWFWLERS